MSPSDPHSSLAALRQLKEMLDAGTITPEEFETLKRQVVFGTEPALPLPLPAETAAPLASEPPEAPAPAPEATSAAYDTLAPNPAELLPPPPASPGWLAAAAPNLLADEETDLPPLAERRNPLNLIFAIGGLLVFLGVVAYLLLGRPAQSNEHLTSSTQTAADSTATVPEVGPQAAQLNLPPVAAPETVRVAPAATSTASQFQVDSSAAPAPAAPVKKAAVPTPTPASPVATDSASKAP